MKGLATPDDEVTVGVFHLKIMTDSDEPALPQRLIRMPPSPLRTLGNWSAAMCLNLRPPRMPTPLLPLLLLPVALWLLPGPGRAAEAGTANAAASGQAPAADPAVIAVAAEPQPGDPVPPGPQDRSLWEQSRQEAEDLWRRSRDHAGRWLEGSQQGAQGLWQDSKQKAGEAWDTTRRYLGPTPQTGFARLWEEVLPTLEETLVLEERQASLPESRWFGEDQASNQAAVDELLDQAVALLSTSTTQDHRQRIRLLQQQINDARQDIAAYRRERVAAPAESLLKKTLADYDAAIADRQADIRRYETELETIKRQFAMELRALGLELTDDQLDFMLTTVVGDNLIDLGILFDNVKVITGQLERLVEESGEDLQSARRYYGLYVILLKSLRQMHLQVELAIANSYIPRIDAIAQRAAELSDQTQALLKQNPDRQAILQANLDAQRLTLEAAAIYRQYLDEQGRQITAARVALETDIATAWNTYETVRVSGELVGIVKASRKLLDGLISRQVPALRPFRNLEMQREFEKLTEQLRTGGGGGEH